MLKTKVAATLRPKNLTVEKKVSLIHAGMNTSMMVDTRGPELQIDEIESPLELIVKHPASSSHAGLVVLEINIPVMCNVTNGKELFQNNALIAINSSTGRNSYGGAPAL